MWSLFNLMKVYVVILLYLLGVNQIEVKSNNEKPKTTLSVNIITDDSSNGFVYVALHSKSDTFPKKGNEAPYVKRVKISGKKSNVIFNKIPYGTYAISAFYDENGNGKLDYNILGIPKESAGTSNNYFGFPKWDKSKFELAGSSSTQVIKLK